MTAITRSLIRFFGRSTAQASQKRAEAIATQKQGQIEITARDALSKAGSTANKALEKTHSSFALAAQKSPKCFQPICTAIAEKAASAQASVEQQLATNQDQAQNAKLDQARAIIKEVFAARVETVSSRALALSCVSDVALNTDLPSTPSLHKALSRSCFSPVSFFSGSSSSPSIDLTRLSLSSQDIDLSPVSTSPIALEPIAPTQTHQIQQEDIKPIPIFAQKNRKFNPVALLQKAKENFIKGATSLAQHFIQIIKKPSSIKQNTPAANVSNEAINRSLAQVMQEQEKASQEANQRIMETVLRPVFGNDTSRFVQASSLLVDHAATTIKTAVTNTTNKALESLGASI